MDNPTWSLSGALAALRKKSGLSRKKLSDVSGLGLSTVSRYESDDYRGHEWTSVQAFVAACGASAQLRIHAKTDEAGITVELNAPLIPAETPQFSALGTQAAAFCRWYVEQYEHAFGCPLVPAWGRDVRLVKRLLATYGDRLKPMAAAFLKGVLKGHRNGHAITDFSYSSPRIAEVVAAGQTAYRPY